MSGLIWRFMERMGAQGVSFIVSIVLARLLNPTIYGTVAIVTVIMSILQVFIDSGMGNALIQKKDADDLDFSTVFIFNLSFSIFLYLLMFATAPLVALFYERAELTAIIRVLCLTLIISGVKNIQQAYISRQMQFRRFFIATLWGTIGAAFVGIIMAYLGFGVWALVAQYLFNGVVDTLFLWFTGDWRPHLKFSFARFKTLFSFGWKLLVTSLLDTAYNDVTQLAVGKIYLPAELALFNRGRQFPGLVVISINSSVDSVMFPVLSKHQDEKTKLKLMTRRAIKIGIYLMAPLMIGLAFIAEPVVRVILGEQWLGCVFYMRVYCIIYMFMPIMTTNISAIKAMGESKIVLKLEIIKKIVAITLFFSTVWISIEAMIYSMLVVCFVNQIANCWPNKILMKYGYLEQIRDVLPSIFLAVVMGILILPVKLLGYSDLVTLCIQIPLGALLYCIGSLLLGFETPRYVLGIIRHSIKRE